MKQDFSYGIIPLCRHNGHWQTILVKMSSGDHRGFPKGHLNPDEDILTGSLRELQEETGITLTVDHVRPELVYRESYEFFHPKKNDTISKTVEYRVAFVDTLDLSGSGLSESDGEIMHKQVLTLEEALAQATYEATRMIIRQLITDSASF